MKKVYYIGLDLAKNVFQLFLADKNGRQLGNRKMTRSQMVKFLENTPGCTIGIEACGTAHHWARTLTAMGHEVKMIQPIRVKAFLGHNNKTDAADAKAICEALMHQGTQFVSPKTVEQQDIDHLLDRRDRLVADRIRIINQTRAFLAERGIPIARGALRFAKDLPEVCAQHWEEFSGILQCILTDNFAEFKHISDAIQHIDDMIEARVQQSNQCRTLISIPGFGKLLALALLSQVGNGQQFKNGRQMSAYFGITPREHSSGGKQKLLGMTKRGNQRIRTLLIMAARAILTGLSRRKKDENGVPIRLNQFDKWVLKTKERLGIFKTAGAVANKLCRVAWALLTGNEQFRPANAVCKI